MLSKNILELYDEGVSILTKNMGIIKAEQFISILLKEPFDYTKWHQNMADLMTKEEFSDIVELSERMTPYSGDISTII